ncbi:SMI1/KNR4 family protein [Alicyclobacillus macrosporangiidus]|uniref:SMI1/KNR4 family protein n=1 Tax=Alicyclobacillus macrosporangiidus TaxID=392015 RepID=UPI0026EA419C|nr:SMI1/KNR4 family protein [Alicyclobacillus macrosporangiidus]
MSKPWDVWVKRWQSAVTACTQMGGDGQIMIAPPATIEQVIGVEGSIGCRLPDSFRKVLLEFSAAVEVSWELPDDVEPPEWLEEVVTGYCYWDLNQIPNVEENRKSWIEKVFNEADDPIGEVWRDKLAFLDVHNGDLMAFELNAGSDGPVVYLAHDDEIMNGYRLGDNFVDFMNRWTVLGCPGPEIWQLDPFLYSPSGGIEPCREEGVVWRRWFGLG